MGVHFYKRALLLKLFILCFIFINNITSVSLMMSVVDRNRQNKDIIHKNNLVQDYEFEKRVDFEEQELENIKTTMIQGMGFGKVPDVTKMNVSQEEYSRMYDVYLNRLQQKQIEDDDSNTENVPRLYSFYQKDRHLRRKRSRDITQMIFNISSRPEALLEHSTLRILAGSSYESGPVLVQVYQILRRNNKRQKTRLIDERHVHLVAGAPKWCDFDVTVAVRSWIENNEPNLGLELHCAECKHRRFSLIHQHDYPVINALITVHGENTRDKRSAEQTLLYEKNRRTDCNVKNSKRCCRHKMDFDLTQLGLNFIIQPKKFDGGICKGRCPPHYNAAHNHAVIQSLMWKKNKNLTPRVCCAPSKLNHLEILTVDEDNPEKLTVKRWENMIVLECACS